MLVCLMSRKCNFDITVENQESTKCTKMGDIQLKLKNSTGKDVTVTLYNVRYVLSFIVNLFSISTAMSNGAEEDGSSKRRCCF